MSACGLKMAVLSNKPHILTQRVIEGLLPAWRFEVVMGECPPVPRKPDPSSALGIASRLGVEPAGFLFLGDTATDMKTSNAAGMYAVGALWDFETPKSLSWAAPKSSSPSPPNCLSCFDGNTGTMLLENLFL